MMCFFSFRKLTPNAKPHFFLRAAAPRSLIFGAVLGNVCALGRFLGIDTGQESLCVGVQCVQLPPGRPTRALSWRGCVQLAIGF